EEEPRLRRAEIDPVCGPLRDRDVDVLAEFQVAIFGTDDPLAVLDEVHFVPLAVPEERLLGHRLRWLRDRERRAGPMHDRLAAADRISLVRHPAGEDVIRLEDVRLRWKVGYEGEIGLPRRLHLLRRIEANMNLAGPGPTEAVGPVDLLLREDLREGVEFGVGGRRHRPFLD